MTSLPFLELTKQLETELFRLHYTEASVVQYRRMWRRIALFLEQKGIDNFTEEAGIRFLDDQFNLFESRESRETDAIGYQRFPNYPNAW